MRWTGCSLPSAGSFYFKEPLLVNAPADVVSSISGVRYVIVFLGAYLLTRLKPGWLTEDFEHRAFMAKTVGTAMIVAGLVILGLSGKKQGGAGASLPMVPAQRRELEI